MDQSFPSLSDDELVTEESFWPSFTDILTVIVMIFLMAMLILLLRNMDLVASLQDNIRQKEQLFSQSEKIKSQNSALQQQLSTQRASLQRLRDRYQQSLQQLEQQALQQQQLSQQLSLQQQRSAQLQKQSMGLSAQLQASQTELTQQRAIQVRIEDAYQSTAQALQERTKQWQSTQQQLAEAQRARALMEDGLQQWRVKAESASDDLLQLRDEYSMLQARYVRLLRPARSPRNKTVIEVLYNLRQGKRIYAWREHHDAAWQYYSLAELEQQLSRFKQQLGKKLYVRIIIPDDSGLSFNQAWDFTHRMLNRYDYYYQQ